MTYKLLRTALLTLHGSRITLSHPYISYFVLRISCCVPTVKLEPPNPQHPTLNSQPSTLNAPPLPLNRPYPLPVPHVPVDRPA